MSFEEKIFLGYKIVSICYLLKFLMSCLISSTYLIYNVQHIYAHEHMNNATCIYINYDIMSNTHMYIYIYDIHVFYMYKYMSIIGFSVLLKTK